MKLSFMRIIDRSFGVPVCAVLTMCYRIGERMRVKRRGRVPVKKIAVLKLSELGAIILAYPMLQRLKADYPAAELFFVTFGRNKELFELLPVVPKNNVLTVSENSWGAFIRDVLSVIGRLRKARVDIVIDMEFFSRCSAVISYLTGARVRAGFDRYTFEGLYRGDLLTHKVPYNPLQHVTRNFLSLAFALGRQSKQTPECAYPIADAALEFPALVPDEDARAGLERKLLDACIQPDHHVVLINPGEGMLPLREWPLERFIEAGSRLLGHPGVRIVFIGTDKARDKAQLMLQRLGPGMCVNMAGQTSLRELMALFHRAQSLLTNDCGLAHLAMLTPIKKFVLFGPESPRVFGPLGAGNRVFYSHWPCSPCLSALNHRDSACRDNLCLKAISADDVYAAMRQHIVCGTRRAQEADLSCGASRP